MAEKPEVNTKKKKLTAEAKKYTEKDEPKLKRARKEEEPANELVDVINLPQAAVMKYVKEVLPDDAKNFTFSDDSQLVFQKAATVFVSYLSHFANDVAKQEKKTTVKESHVVEALETMGMAHFKAKLPLTEEKPKPEKKEKKEKPEKKEKSEKSEKSVKTKEKKEKKEKKRETCEERETICVR
jgi:histone H3/H4